MRKRDLYDNAILIAPPSMKRALLSYRAEYPEQNFSIYSVEEIESAFSYHHDDRLIIDLIKKGYGYLEATEIANVLDHMKDKKDGYKSKKLRDLQPLFEKYRQNGYLFKLDYPERTFGNRQYVLLGYYSGKRISAALSEMPNIGVVWDGVVAPREDKVELHSFPDVHGEFHYVCNRVAKLIDDGVSPEDIYLIGLDESSYFEFSLMAESYGFGIAAESPLSLKDTELGIRFLRAYGSGESLEDALKECDDGSDGYQSIDLKVRAYSIPELSKERQLAVFEAALGDAKVPQKKKTGAVQVTSSRYVPEGSHAFLMSFVLGKSPRIHRDNGYIGDSEKKELGLPTSIELNIQDETEVLGLLRKKELEAVTFSFRHGQEDFHPSPLLKSKEANIEASPSNDLPYEYSQDLTSLWLTHLEDRKEKFSASDPRIDLIKKKTGLAASPKHDPSFVPFEGEKPKTSGHLSASSVTSFYQCPFHYYCAKILGIDDSEYAYSARVGTLFHDALQDIYENKTDPKESLQNQIQKAKEEKPFTEMESLLLNRLCERFLVVLEFTKNGESRMRNPEFICEEWLTYKLGDDREIVGRADKIILTGDHREFISIVDYKSGGTKFVEDEMEFGLSLQLPTYDLLRHGNKNLKDKKLAGLFIAPILPPVAKRDDNESETQTIEGSVKLAGIFSANLERMSTLDPNVYDSDYIEGLKQLADGGFALKNHRPKSDEQFAAYLDLTKRKYEEAFERIEKGGFEIAPLVVDGKNRACSYCPFADVCFHNPSMNHEVHLPKKENKNG